MYTNVISFYYWPPFLLQFLFAEYIQYSFHIFTSADTAFHSYIYVFQIYVLTAYLMIQHQHFCLVLAFFYRHLSDFFFFFISNNKSVFFQSMTQPLKQEQTIQAKLLDPLENPAPHSPSSGTIRFSSGLDAITTVSLEVLKNVLKK